MTRPLRILINATSARLGGGITVIKNLVPALTEVDGGRHRYTIVTSRETADALALVHPRVQVHTPEVARRRGLRVLWEQLGLPLQARGFDVLFSPANLGVLASPIPQVLMFQNLAPFDARVRARSPLQGRARLEALRLAGMLSARAAARVVFLSDHARDVTAPQLGIDPARVRRMDLGRDPSFAPEARAQAPAVLSRLGLRAPYLLSVSHFYFYKNLVELVDAFALARPRLPPGTVLALAGGHSDAATTREVREAIARGGLSEHVRLLGEVPHEDLPALYAACALFVFPSTCESFPNILVEGLASGAPTLASNLGPMPEIAGDGAEYVDPFDRAALAAKLVALVSDPAACEGLRQRGLLRVRRYSWESSARALLSVFEEV